MTRDELFKIVDHYALGTKGSDAIMTAVDAYTAASNGAKPIVSGSLPLTIKGLDVEALANTLYDKWRVNYDGRYYMPRDLFTLAIQDIVRGGNDR